MKPVTWGGWFGVSTLVWAGVVASPGRVAAEPVTEEFGCIGESTSWTVPDGVTEATFDVYGARGGEVSPGAGGHVVAVVDVTPRETMQITVGCQGGDDPGGGAGGFNGGGDGGAASDGSHGGGGGGASDVRRDGDGLDARILVAGGGGGGSGNGFSGGDGGNPGADGEDGGIPGSGGGGATVDAPGDGGEPGLNGEPGEAGEVGAGGNGGDSPGTWGGGGGGGGFYGGGGGGTGTDLGDGTTPGAGGGGSSFAASGIDATFETGVSEGDGLITITYEEPNQAPEPVDDEVATTAGEVVEFNVLENDSDPDGDPLTLVDNTQPTSGTVECADDGSCTYTPGDGFTGDDGFVYTMTDGLSTPEATVTITVSAPANQAPTPTDDEVEAVSGESATFNVLENDSDPDGDPLILTDNTEPASGTVECNQDGSCTYTPDDGFSGEDGFTYTVSDGVDDNGEIGSASVTDASVTITVSPAPTTTTSPPSTSTVAPTTTVLSTTTVAPNTTVAPSTTAAAVIPPTTTTTLPSTLPETGGGSAPMFTVALLLLAAGTGLIVFTSRGHTPRVRTHNSGRRPR